MSEYCINCEASMKKVGELEAENAEMDAAIDQREDIIEYLLSIPMRVRIAELEADLAWFKSRHTAAGCGMDATTGSLRVMTTGAYCSNDVPNAFDHGEE